MAIFRANPQLDRELRKHPDYRHGIAAAAGDARREAESLARAAGAPWMRRKGAAQTVVIDTDGDEVRLVNTDHAGHLMEWGSVNNPPHAPLRRGVRAAGLRLEED